MSDIERVIKRRSKSGGFGERNSSWVSSVTIGRRGKVWINGTEVPWFIHEDGVNVTWDEGEGEDPKVGRLSLELVITDDDTIITDLRPEDGGR